MVEELATNTNQYDEITAMFMILNSIHEEKRLLCEELIPHFLYLWEKPEHRKMFSSFTQVEWIATQLEWPKEEN